MDERLHDLANQASAILARVPNRSAAFSELSQGLALLPRTAGADPSAALVRVRKTLQFAVDALYEKRFGEPAGTRPLENLLQRLAKEGNFPKKLAAFANLVRDLGNVGAHSFGEAITVADVSRALEQLLPILSWYADEVAPGPGSEAGVRPAQRNARQLSLVPLSPPHPKRAGVLGMVLVAGGAVAALVLIWLFWHLLVRGISGSADTTARHSTAPAVLPAWADQLKAAPVLQLVYGGTPPDAPEEQLSMTDEILALRNGSKETELLTDGDSLTSRDGYILKLKVNRGGYLYVFQVDTQGNSTLLHPLLPGFEYSEGANPVAAYAEVSIPSAESQKKLKLDNELGVEHVYAVFSLARWLELEEALRICERTPGSSSGGSSVTQPLRLAFRGVGGKDDIEESGRPPTVSTPVVRRQNEFVAAKARGLVVERWFNHVGPAP